MYFLQSDCRKGFLKEKQETTNYNSPNTIVLLAITGVIGGTYIDVLCVEVGLKVGLSRLSKENDSFFVNL